VPLVAFDFSICACDRVSEWTLRSFGLAGYTPEVHGCVGSPRPPSFPAFFKLTRAS
jgi:hypothetical protein